MNADCVWPPEGRGPLTLANAADRRHLVVDTELAEELVDRYRFHIPNEQLECEQRLAEAVARTHAVSLADVANARDQIPRRGVDLPVSLPVAALFVLTVVALSRRVERRFVDERFAGLITLALASIAVSMLFVLIGEFWSSILEMIRVGSQHVGGRVARLPWKRHEQQIFVAGVVLFWTVLALRGTAFWRVTRANSIGGLY
jgi:hypothetical protein